ncbi:peroxide stress protein YaaA [Cognatishimia activa]|uniref:peroxide stress protein YaaA n=1 Tax=Cognatishimia activa TaxID=1715691 RepID=UPI002230CD2E|nr:peroxide stress protein YaaA [Cognatishimia activa]UZD90895.1 peroxide stress protein YaaA [Cognatishimia activa]
MLVVVSPAKRLDWDPVATETTTPALHDEAEKLVKTARNLTLGNLQKLMDLSPDLAKLNRDRFKAFEMEPDTYATRPAAYAFAGDTYIGLEAKSLDQDEMTWAQDHLRILSGLYGVLRPLDAIQPYRLEMGSRLKTRRGKNLYEFWRDTLSKNLNAQAEEIGTETLINCASQEYFGAVDLKRLKLRVITPVFMELKNGQPKIVSFFAKKARGSMARFIIQNRLTEAEGIKDFDLGGYAYQPEMSEGDKWVFLRDYPETAS